MGTWGIWLVCVRTCVFANTYICFAAPPPPLKAQRCPIDRHDEDDPGTLPAHFMRWYVCTKDPTLPD